MQVKIMYHLTSHTFSDLCFLMRADDLVIYDLGLGSEQTVFLSIVTVGMPLSKAVNPSCLADLRSSQQ